jgi:hypothetical protein
MNAQRARNGRRIDQALERRVAGQREIAAFAVMQGGDAFFRKTLHPGRRFLRLQAARQDQAAGGDGAGVVPADAHLDLSGRWRRPQKRGVQHYHAAMRLNRTNQRVHVAMRIEDPAFGRVQRAHRAQGRLQGQGLRGVQAGHAFDPIGLAARGQCVQRREFIVLRGHDELATFVVGNVVAIEEVVQQAPSLDTETGLQRTWRVVQAGVDHLRIARGDARTHTALTLQHRHAVALAGQRIPAGQAHCTGPHHDCVKVDCHGPRIAERRPHR